MSGANSRKLPKRLQIDFRSTKPTYKLYTDKGCNRRDLQTAGLSDEIISTLLRNSYSNEEMRYTLIRPEEWFWTDRGWWSEKGSHLDAMYEISGGAFSDLTHREQADLLGVDFIEMIGKKAKGTTWISASGEPMDIVRYTHERLVSEGYQMAPPSPEGISLLVKNHCKEAHGKDISFIDDGKPEAEELRRLAKLSVREVFDDPAKIWNQRPDYYLGIFNGLRKIKDFDLEAVLSLIDIVGKDNMIRIHEHYWTHQTYQNQMRGPGLTQLVGRRDGELRFFFVKQKVVFKSGAAAFVRDYAKPLGLSVSLIQLSPEK